MPLLALLPNKLFDCLHILSLSNPAKKGVQRGMQRVQGSRFNSSVMLPRPDFFYWHCFSVAYIMASVRLKRILRGDSNNPDRQCCYISNTKHFIFACQCPGALLIAFTMHPLPCKQYLSPEEQAKAWSWCEGLKEGEADFCQIVHKDCIYLLCQI